MEIKSIKDLIQYRQSLKELWDKEEFQPVLAFLSSMYEEAVDGIRSLNIQEGFATAVRVATLKNQMNFANLFFKLPEAIKLAEEMQEKAEAQALKFQSSQEGGSI